MNLPSFLKKVDSYTQGMTQDELRIFIHELARTLSGERREDFLEQLRTAASIREPDNGYEMSDSADKEKLVEQLHHIQDILLQIDEGVICLTSEINEEYDDWYNSSAEEFLFEDPEDILGTVDTAMDLIHRCVDMELYKEGCELAELLSVISAHDAGEYEACIGETLDVYDLDMHGLLTCDFDRLCRDSLYLAYQGNEMEYRPDEIYMMMGNLRCWRFGLEDMMQNGREELEQFDEFLDLWTEYLSAQQGSHVDRLIQEAQSLVNNEERELESARKHAAQHPSLYEQFLKKYQKAGDDQKFFEIGREALSEVPDTSAVRSRIALLTAGYALRAGKPDEAERCWVEAFRSEKNAVNFFRIFIECRDYSGYKKDVKEICESMNEGTEHYYTVLFLNGRFQEVLDNGMDTKKALGWSYTFMKKGLRLFLLYLYRGKDLPAGMRRMCMDVTRDLAFSKEEYCQGLEKEIVQEDCILFWQCFCGWKEKNLMSEEEQLKIMERLEQLIELRVDGIMGANRRNYYGECAAFIAACGEVKESWGEQMGKQGFMDMYRQRYSRRTAFRQELNNFGYSK